MTAYRCRFVAPRASDWSTVEADSPELAANEFHSWDTSTVTGSPHSISYTPDPERATQVYFARVEVDGYAELVSRIYTSGIARRAGEPGKRQRPPGRELSDVAKAVGWERDPSELVADGWDGEDAP